MFLACLAEMLPTPRMNTGRLPVLTGSVQVRSVMIGPVSFQVQSISVDCLSGGGVLVLNQDRMASFSRQEGDNI